MIDQTPTRAMKPKRAYKATAKEPSPMDNCGTPMYALDPLLQYISKDTLIWEPAAGDGRLVRNLERFGYEVDATCITTGFNFFETPSHAADMIITNPPYGIKFQWIERCYELGIPFALLVPVETIGSQRCQKSMKAHGAEILLLNRRVNFYMPNKGFDGQAQFPVLWFCHKVLPEPICYGEINYYPEPE